MTLEDVQRQVEERNAELERMDKEKKWNWENMCAWREELAARKGGSCPHTALLTAPRATTTPRARSRRAEVVEHSHRRHRAANSGLRPQQAESTPPMLAAPEMGGDPPPTGRAWFE